MFDCTEDYCLPLVRKKGHEYRERHIRTVIDLEEEAEKLRDKKE